MDTNEEKIKKIIKKGNINFTSTQMFWIKTEIFAKTCVHIHILKCEYICIPKHSSVCMCVCVIYTQTHLLDVRF